MEPSAAISVIETDLRHVVRVVLAAIHGDKWMDASISEEVTQKLQERQSEEAKRRAPARVPSDLLAYTHLYELRSLIEKNWQSFVPVFKEKKELTVLLDKVEDFRNAPSHSRELLPHERSLLEGIAGTLRTAVTLYLSSQAPDAKHYPVIESIRDSFGNTVELLDSNAHQVVRTGLRLQVGQVVEYEARAWDPQGREITWQCGAPFASSGSKHKGSDVRFSWSPTPTDVGLLCPVQIEMLSAGPYHRWKHYDHSVTFIYTVEPPT